VNERRTKLTTRLDFPLHSAQNMKDPSFSAAAAATADEEGKRDGASVRPI
jgi:hypothetical protein